MKNILLLSTLLLSLPTYALSLNDVSNTVTKNTITQNTSTTTSQIEIAKEWNLTEFEWNQYLKFMQGPSGRYYQKLSPPEVLGIQSETNDDLMHFAEVAAKLEHDKLERELRFNLAFHQAASKLYFDEPLIKPFDYGPFTPILKN
jgi:integrating conjugative element protein (TIGR03759 family)